MTQEEKKAISDKWFDLLFDSAYGDSSHISEAADLIANQTEEIERLKEEFYAACDVLNKFKKFDMANKDNEIELLKKELEYLNDLFEERTNKLHQDIKGLKERNTLLDNMIQESVAVISLLRAELKYAQEQLYKYEEANQESNKDQEGEMEW